MSTGLVKRIGQLELCVIQGDITQIPATALMTAINSSGLWYGGIDGAIQRVAGNHYHAQAQKATPLENLQTLVAKGSNQNHRGKFEDVIFVVDDLKSPLDKIIYAGLHAAQNRAYSTVLIPAIRMGVMAGIVEKSPKEAVAKIAAGIHQFADKYVARTSLKNITFVVYNDIKTMSQLATGFCENPLLN